MLADSVTDARSADPGSPDHPGPSRPATPPEVDRLAMDVVRATEAAAIAAADWSGRGDKNSADAAAVEAMRVVLAGIPMRGTVVIGEGEKDQAPMLHHGEWVGSGDGPGVDVAVDPVDGTSLTARGMANALSVVALAPRGAMQVPPGVFYLDKLACGPADLGVAVLDRPRHLALAAELREVGARVHFFSDGDGDGDVAAAVLAAGEGGEVDLLLGVGGTPEGPGRRPTNRPGEPMTPATFPPPAGPELSDLRSVAHRLVRNGRGILAADESIATMNARLAAVGVAPRGATPARLPRTARYDPRPGGRRRRGDHLLRDARAVVTGRSAVPVRLARDGLLAGVKVDTGTVAPAGTDRETITEGLDGQGHRADRGAGGPDGRRARDRALAW